MIPQSDVRPILDAFMETAVWLGANEQIRLQTHANAELGVWDPINDALTPTDTAAHVVCRDGVSWWRDE